MASPLGEGGPAVSPHYESLREAGLRYLDRYDASAAKLRRILTQKARAIGMRLAESERPDPDTVTQWVDQILERFLESGVISDRRYSERLASSLRARGLGRRAIENRLRERGIEAEIARCAIEQTDEGCDDSELLAAGRLVKRRKLGYLRNEERRGDCRNRDLGTLARAGFSWETARKALEGPVGSVYSSHGQ